MRDPKVVENSLSSKARDPNYRYERVFRNLYNVQFYLDAYHMLYPSAEQEPPHLVAKLTVLIHKLKTQTYKPTTVLKRPLEELLLQHVLCRLLHSMVILPKTTHPMNHLHTTLQSVQSSCAHVSWFITVKTNGPFSAPCLLRVVRKRINDNRFLRLLSLFADEWNIWELVVGIALREVDLFMDQYRSSLLRETLESHTTRSFFYKRHHEEWIIGVDGSKGEAEAIQRVLTTFLTVELGLTLEGMTSKVISSRKKTCFLRHTITIEIVQGVPVVRLLFPREVCLQQLLALGAITMDSHARWKPTHRPLLLYQREEEILDCFYREIEERFTYYQLVDNVSVLRLFYRAMRGSFYKTVASKHRTSVRVVRKRHANFRTF